MAVRCECGDDSRNNPNSEFWYEEEERKAMRHAPNKCPGDVRLAVYKMPDGTEKVLCSCCNRSEHVFVREVSNAGA